MKNYDYAQAGAYFVTICSQNRECLFGNIRNGEMHLNGPGLMLKKWWLELTNKFKNIEMDKYVIMPNHLHEIIFIVGADLCVCPNNKTTHIKTTHAVGADLCVCPNGSQVCPDNNKSIKTGNHMRTKGAHTGAPLHRVIQWFKTMSTNDYLKHIHE